MANNVCGLAKLLNVEMYERFKLRRHGEVDEQLYFFDEEKGLMCERNGRTYMENAVTLGNIIMGKYEVVKRPWRPRYNKPYFMPSTSEHKVVEATWANNTYEHALLLLGMVYHTREEAEAHLAEDYQRLTGKPLSSVE